MSIPVLTSRIDSVTVYRQGALVCRTAIVLAAQPVPPQIKLVNLPLSLDDGSVRVRVEGEGSDLPVASDVRVALDLAVTEHDLPPPDDEALKLARRAVAEIAERLAQLRGQRRRCERLQVFERPANKRGQPPLASPVRARLALLEFRAKAIAGLDQRIHDALAWVMSLLREIAYDGAQRAPGTMYSTTMRTGAVGVTWPRRAMSAALRSSCGLA